MYGAAKAPETAEAQNLYRRRTFDSTHSRPPIRVVTLRQQLQTRTCFVPSRHLWSRVEGGKAGEAWRVRERRGEAVCHETDSLTRSEGLMYGLFFRDGWLPSFALMQNCGKTV